MENLIIYHYLNNDELIIKKNLLNDNEQVLYIEPKLITKNDPILFITDKIFVYTNIKEKNIPIKNINLENINEQKVCLTENNELNSYMTSLPNTLLDKKNIISFIDILNEHIKNIKYELDVPVLFLFELYKEHYIYVYTINNLISNIKMVNQIESINLINDTFNQYKKMGIKIKLFSSTNKILELNNLLQKNITFFNFNLKDVLNIKSKTNTFGEIKKEYFELQKSIFIKNSIIFFFFLVLNFSFFFFQQYIDNENIAKINELQNQKLTLKKDIEQTEKRKYTDIVSQKNTNYSNLLYITVYLRQLNLNIDNSFVYYDKNNNYNAIIALSGLITNDMLDELKNKLGLTKIETVSSIKQLKNNGNMFLLTFDLGKQNLDLKN